MTVTSSRVRQLAKKGKHRGIIYAYDILRECVNYKADIWVLPSKKLLTAITSLRRSGLHGELNPSWAKSSAPHAQSLISRYQYDVFVSVW